MPIPPLYAHEGIRHRLVGAIASGRLPQALLFEGPTGVGKQRLALWLAQALMCEAGLGEGCGKCQHCKLVLNLSHPDVHWFVPLELSKKGGAAPAAPVPAALGVGEPWNRRGPAVASTPGADAGDGSPQGVRDW